MTDYNILSKQLEAFAKEDRRWVPLMSNASALLWESLQDINWAGFYTVDHNQLVLGPFQGRPACIHIPKDHGVCGTAWAMDKTLVVPDVHKFPGHIACDSASNSEIVIPLHKYGSVRAVLDIDSPSFDRFSEEDLQGLTGFAKTLELLLEW